jgi:hypothetical protein
MSTSLKSPTMGRAGSTGQASPGVIPVPEPGSCNSSTVKNFNTPGVIPAPEPGSCNNSTVNNFNTPAPHIRGNDITDGGEPLLQVIGAGAAVTGLGFDTLPEREPPVIDRLIAILPAEARH